MKRLIIALLCLAAVNAAVVSCEGYDDYVKNLKSKSLTKDEAKAEWESFLSDINDEEVEITDGEYVTVRFHELVPMTIDEIIHWVEGDSVGEKTWK